MRATTIMCAAALAPLACVNEVRLASVAPARAMPAVTPPATSAPDGHQYVVFDVPNERATVSEAPEVTWKPVTGNGDQRFFFANQDIFRPNDLCVTPCVVALTLGEHTVEMSSGDRHERINVRVTSDPLVVRHVFRRDVRGRPARVTAGDYLSAFGVGQIGGGLLTTVIDVAVGGSYVNGVLAAGIASMGVGVVMLVIGSVLRSYVISYVPAATTSWTLERWP